MLKLKKKINEYDYLCVSARIHALENRLLTKERMERMLDARTAEEAAKIPGECGYPEFDDLTPAGIEKTLSAVRADTVADLRKLCPDPAIVDVFSIQYDYHNAKALVKAQPLGEDPAKLLIDAGRYPAEALAEDFDRDDLHGTETFVAAVKEAKGVLAETGDPQKADMVLDRAYYAELIRAAEQSRSGFLKGYVALSIDLANLRSTVRAMRMGRDGSFLKEVLMEGGDLPVDKFLTVGSGAADLTAAISGPLAEAAQAGAKALEGGALTDFEKKCDNALTAYLGKAKSVAFGEQPVIGYLYARQSEATTIRIILTGLRAGLDGDTIRERLRESYV